MRGRWTLGALVLAGFAALAPRTVAENEGTASEDEVVGWIGERPVRISNLAAYTVAEWGSQGPGDAALEHLIQVAIVETESARRGIAVADSELDEQVAFLRETVAQSSGGALTLEEQLATQGLDLKRFRATLRQAIACQRMIRQDFGLPADRPVPGDKQTLWYNEKRIHLGVRTEGLPGDEAARVQERVIDVQEWGETIYRSLSAEARSGVFEDLATIELLLKAAQSESLEIDAADIDEELAARDVTLRRQLEKAGQQTEGVSFLQVLARLGKRPARTLQDRQVPSKSGPAKTGTPLVRCR